MALYVGDTVALKIDLTDPFSKEVLLGYTGFVDLWTPGRKPKSDPTVRSTPDVEGLEMEFDDSRDAYMVYIDTSQDGFVSGTWNYRITVEGPTYSNIEYGSFKLSV